MPEQGWEMLPKDAVTHILIKIIFIGLGEIQHSTCGIL